MDKICRTIIPQLPDFINGKLDNYETQLVRDHLDGCSTCRMEEENIRGIYASLSSQASFTPPSDSYWNTIVPRLHEKIEQRQHGFRLIPGWIYRIVLPLAVASLIVVVLFRSSIFSPAATNEDLLTSVQQMSDEERAAIVNEFSATLPENTEEYAVADSIIMPFRRDAAEAARSESFEYIYEYQFAPEILLESLSPEEVEQVMTKLQTRHYISS